MGSKERSNHQNQFLRIDTICRLTQENIPYFEIQQRLQTISEVQVYSDVVGKNSVDNVKRVIQSFPFTTDIIETIPNSREDSLYKRDLIIKLIDKNVYSVGIQVKSSIKNILSFYKKFDKDFFKAKEILVKRKLIVLNGQLPDNIIQKNFLEQLTAIDKYHQNLS